MHKALDHADGAMDVFLHVALPETHDRPSGPRELAVVSPVTFLVSLHLRSPEGGVCLGESVMFGTPMPETPVYEDS